MIHVRHVLNNFGIDVTVIFYGYREAMSTKVAEQQRRATQNTSPDSIFELDMTVSTPHNRFLANRRHRATHSCQIICPLSRLCATGNCVSAISNF